MKKQFLLSICFVLCACSYEHVSPEVAKKILENREKYALEIRDTVKECTKNANTNRDVHYNDSNEVLKTCIQYAQESYGAYSQYVDEYLTEQSLKASK